MGTVYRFVEGFLPAQQFAGAVAVLESQCPEEMLQARLSSERVTVLLPADSGLVHTATALGYTGNLSSEALRYLIVKSAEQLKISLIQALRQIVLAHIAPAAHEVPQDGEGGLLRMLSGENMWLNKSTIKPSTGKWMSNLMVSDQACSNGFVHVISHIILPDALRMPRISSHPDGSSAPPQDEFRARHIEIPVVRPAPVTSHMPQLILDTDGDTFRFSLDEPRR